MPLSTAAQVGVASIPTGIKAFNELINPSKPTGYEKKLAKLAEMFGNQASMPVTQNSAFTEGKSVLDAKDKKNRKNVANMTGAGNVTNEVKLTAMNNANDSYAQAISRLIGNAQRFKQAMTGQQINAMSLQENAKQGRLANRQSNTASFIQPMQSAINSFLFSDLVNSKE